MHNDSSIEIDCPIEKVYRLTCEHVEQWSNIVVEDVVLGQTADEVGTTFRTVTEDNGRRMEFQGVVTKCDPPYLHAAQLVGKSFDIDTEFKFEDLSGRTRVTQTANVTGKGFFRVLMFMFGWLMCKSHCKASEAELQSLKNYCENYSE